MGYSISEAYTGDGWSGKEYGFDVGAFFHSECCLVELMGVQDKFARVASVDEVVHAQPFGAVLE